MTERIFHAAQVRKGDRVLLTCADERWTDEQRVAVVEGLRERFPGVEFTIVSGVSGMIVAPAIERAEPVAVNLLLSFAYHADTDLRTIRTRLRCGQLMIDSGAFTAYTSGRRIRVYDYARYLTRWAGVWDHAITLDRIGDPANTRRNTRMLHERGLAVMPVFTMGETLAEFDAMVREHRYVAVGGLVGGGLRVGRESIKPLTRRLGMLQRRALDAGGGIHALGVGSCQILHAARTYSADTSTAESVTNYGNVLFYDGRGLRQVHACTPRDPRWRDTLRWRDHILAHGIDLAAVARHGRIPARSKRALMIGFVTGYACADEVLRRHDVLPPTGGPPGTILYIAPASSGSAHYALDADERLHNGSAAPVWQHYGRAHVCQRGAVVGVGG